MAYIIAGLMAALSFLLNRAALRYMGPKTVITCGPVMEELAKTVLAVYLGADIFLTHVTFGVIEGGYDWSTGVRQGPAAAVFSIVGHAVFGGLTVVVLYFTASVPAALAAGIIVHLGWNITMIRFFA